MQFFLQTVELQKEVVALKESDSMQRLRAQKAVQQLKDVENELRDLRAKNDALEKKYKRYVYGISFNKYSECKFVFM